MKLKINKNAIETEELITQLTKHYEGKYTISKRNSKTIVVAKGKIYGAIIFVQKDRLMVVSNFPNLMIQISFTILSILLGIIIPLLFYFLVLHKKMKIIENDVVTFIKTTYNDKIITS